MSTTPPAKLSATAPAPSQEPPPEAPPARQSFTGKPQDRSTERLGPYVDPDGQATKPEPSGTPREAVIPVDYDDLPDAFK